MLVRLSVLTALFAAAAQASNVLDLTSSNFDEVIGKGKPALVELCVNLLALMWCTSDKHISAASFAPWWYVSVQMSLYLLLMIPFTDDSADIARYVV